MRRYVRLRRESRCITDEITQLRKVLTPVLKMIVVTFIMAHYLSVADSDVQAVLHAIQHSEIPQWDDPYVISSMLNRQLKYHFAEIRQKMYLRTLQQLQTLLLNSGKDRSWLQSFCVLLGCAICLEEAQNTIFLQANTAIEQGDVIGREAEETLARATSMCSEMDASFDFMLKLFHTKYRDSKWDEGSFGRHTPLQSDPASHRFLQDVHALLRENSEFWIMGDSWQKSLLT